MILSPLSCFQLVCLVESKARDSSEGRPSVHERLGLPTPSSGGNSSSGGKPNRVPITFNKDDVGDSKRKSRRWTKHRTKLGFLLWSIFFLARVLLFLEKHLVKRSRWQLDKVCEFGRIGQFIRDYVGHEFLVNNVLNESVGNFHSNLIIKILRVYVWVMNVTNWLLFRRSRLPGWTQ
jgi:hypothetical protein